jgi:hypothetical protein
MSPPMLVRLAAYVCLCLYSGLVRAYDLSRMCRRFFKEQGLTTGRQCPAHLMPSGEVAMKPFVLLRAASIVALLYAVGHTMGFPWVPDKGPETAAIVQSMAAHTFDAMGARRSLLDFYLGFGISISVFMFAQAILLWMVAAQTRLDAPRMRPIIALFLLSFVVNAVIAGIYFFIVPCVLGAIETLCLAAAWITAKPETVGSRLQGE